MEALRQIAMNIKALKMKSAMKAILSDTELQDFIIDLNTQEQLYQGIDATNTDLREIGGDYSKKTVEIKQKKGQPINRVTLKDTGEFYESFRVKALADSFDIIADTLKEDGDLQDRWGSELLGLTDYNAEMLAVKIAPLLRIYFIQNILT